MSRKRASKPVPAAIEPEAVASSVAGAPSQVLGADQSHTEGTTMPDGDMPDDRDFIDEELAEEVLLLSADTLRGDVRDAILDQIKHLKKPFQQLSEMEQEMVISHADKIARNLCRQAVRLVAAEGNVQIEATIDSVQVKDGLKITMAASGLALNRHELTDHVKKRAFIVLIDDENHDGEQQPATAEPDQGRLALAEDDGPVMDKSAHGEGDDGANIGSLFEDEE